MIMRPNLQTTLCCVCSRLFSRHWLIVPVFVFISAVSAHSFGQDQLSEREQALQPPKVFINPDETQYSSTRRIFQGIPRIERASNGRLWVSRFSGGGGEGGPDNYALLITSGDDGRTWSPVKPGSIKHTVARFHIRRLNSGNLLLVKHGPIDKRTRRELLTAYHVRTQ